MPTAEFKFECPHCHQHLQCDVHFAGRQIQCPSCSKLFNIPNAPAGSGFTQVQKESGRTWNTFVPPPHKPD
jgi:hypothetical protein